MNPTNPEDPSEPLPVEAVRTDLEAALETGPVVLTAPTAAGKSTQVPRWLVRNGNVLVVEPRRIACRSLAVRVAGLEGCRLGDEVGYSVRDDHRAGSHTRILFATPGVVLRMLADTDDKPVLDEFHSLIIDEFHERRLDVDLILALARNGFQGGLVVMSATMDGDRVAQHLRGHHVESRGRTFPVANRHLAGGTILPSIQDLEDRVVAALESVRNDPGDVLVFLPGKGEIARLAGLLGNREDIEVLELHGGLTLEEQGRVFEASRTRRVILATNVAETSITLPGIGVVIDSGLVRQTRYHNDRGFLTLVPIAEDSAAQRAGRAGRLGPGLCCRLWSETARLDPVTAPEMHRESLVPLVLAAAACRSEVDRLSFLDPPKAHALASAISDLCALGILESGGRMTGRGRQVFGLPLDAPMGRLLVEAETAGCLPDVVDLVSVLSVGRPLFVAHRRPVDEKDDLRKCGNDALAAIHALRDGDPQRNGLSRFTLKEARSNRLRLRKAWGLPAKEKSGSEVDVRRLAMTAIAADPRCVHVARRRRGRVAWSNGGTEVELGRESAVSTDRVEAIAVLDTHAMGLGSRDTRILVTCAIPLPIPWVLDAGLGRDHLESVTHRKGAVLSRIARTHARKVLQTREETPTGRLAREALRDLFLRGSILKEALAPTRERLAAAALFRQLLSSGRVKADELAGFEFPYDSGSPVPSLEEWVMTRLEELGVESGEDLALLSPEDLLAQDLPEPIRKKLDGEFPREISVGDAAYGVEYDLVRHSVILHKIRGSRKAPPPLAYLPSFRGFGILLKEKNRTITLRKP